MAFLENIFPLIFIYLVWKFFSGAKRSLPKGSPREKPAAAGPAAEGADGQIVPIDLGSLLRQIFLGEVPTPPMPVPRHTTPPPPVFAEQDIVATSHRREQKESVTLAMPSIQARPACLGPDRPNLRQAIVWSEILAKPIALREESL